MQKKGFYIVSADVNNLKKTNDEHGHSAGDLLLTTFIDTLKKNLSHKSVIYRTGGDEFMIIFHSSDENEVATQMEQAEKAANARNVYFAYGICGYDSAAGIDEIVRRADEQMYIKKAEMKHRADAPDSAAR